MRVLRLLMLGVLLVATAKCFELAFVAAQDTREALVREKWKAHALVVHGRRAVTSTSALAVAAAPLEVDDADAAPMEFEPLDLTVPEEQPSTPPAPVRRTVPRRHVAKLEPAPAPQEELATPDEALRMALRRKRTLFERCYEAELKKQAAFNGFVVVSVTVAADGRVTNAHLEESSRRDAAVGACIVGQLRQLKLPPVTEEADLIIPIRLEARQDT